MKNYQKIRKNLVLASFTVLLFSCNQVTSTKEATFYVRGNCGMCEERIENAVNSMDGIVKADWNVKTKNITVTYDTTKVKELKIQQTIANVGHETKFVQSPTSVHDSLPECCKKNGSM